MATSLKSYEKKYKALEDIVKQLDDGDMTISELLSQYKKGLTLVKECAESTTNYRRSPHQRIRRFYVQRLFSI